MFNKNTASATLFLRQALLRIGLTLGFFMLCRLVFYTFNRAILPTPMLTDFLWGIRFDLSAAAYVNVVLWISYGIPFDFRAKKNYQIFQKTLFLLTNFAAFAFEFIDVAFFKFQNRRTLLTDFGLVKNTAQMLPSFLAEYWFLLVWAVVFFFFLAFLYDKTTLDLLESTSLNLPQNTASKASTHASKMIIFDKVRPFLIQFSIFILSLAAWLLAARGGTQLRPITPLSTTDVASDMRLMPLVSNTTLNFIHSTGQKFITNKTYRADAEAEAIYPIFDQFESNDSFRKLNVVILTLESFGKEYSHYFNAEKTDYQGFTPFLDSLAQASFQAKQSFANGLRSAQGIVAVTSGLPSLMEDPFVFSPYQSNRIDGLAAHLTREGYETAFFHGSNPGSMEFDKFARLTGFNHFYDRYGYGNQADYDGNWGIWDAPMLQFMAQKLTQTPEPFYGFFFSLTSHHPYNVPEDFEKKYPNVDALHRSVLYADDALHQFFETAKKQPWFDRTLFVICADHVGAGSFVPEYQTKVGRYNIPILFYKPNEIKAETRPDVVQQQDIMPSVLDFLNYKKPFLAFGRSIFEKNKEGKRYSFHFEEGLYQIHDAQFALFFDGDRTTGLYDYTTDVFLRNNLKDSLPNDAARLENVLKAVVQQYNKAMQENHLTPN